MLRPYFQAGAWGTIGGREELPIQTVLGSDRLFNLFFKFDFGSQQRSGVNPVSVMEAHS